MVDKIKKELEIIFFSFPTFRKITVGGFVNQLIEKFWPKTAAQNQVICCRREVYSCSTIDVKTGFIEDVPNYSVVCTHDKKMKTFK